MSTQNKRENLDLNLLSFAQRDLVEYLLDYVEEDERTDPSTKDVIADAIDSFISQRTTGVKYNIH